MYTTTLRGVFPDPKPVYRRNFIKENVKSIKQMQGILQDAGVIQPRKRTTLEKYRNAPRSRDSNTAKSTGNLSKIEVKTNPKVDEKSREETSEKTRASNATSTYPLKNTRGKIPSKKRETANAHTLEEDRVSHRAIQTEREENLCYLYDTGVIKYPSQGIVKPKKSNDTPSPRTLLNGQGDQVEEITKNMENLTTEDKDFIKENRQNIRPRPSKQSPVKVIAQAPANYQRGVVPKYLRDKKEDNTEQIDTECPPGHILLPEEERKETLRVLRQSYADRIQELNMMPVRNDTLKMRKRKMEIEEELKRIDGGIKVFQRPKVFVRINA